MGLFDSRLKMRKGPIAVLLAAALALVASMQNCSHSVGTGASTVQSNGNGGSYGGGNWRGFHCEGPAPSGSGILQLSLVKNADEALELIVSDTESGSTERVPVLSVQHQGEKSRFSGTGIEVTVYFAAKTGQAERSAGGTPVTYDLKCQ